MQTGEMSAVVLAGGKSSRMGRNKMLLPLGEETVVSSLFKTLSGLFSEYILVTDQPDAYRFLPARIVRDLISCPVKNSLVGIHAGLSASTTSYNFILAGDMPFVRRELIHYLCTLADGYDVVIPRDGKYYQPLCAVYHVRCIPFIENFLMQKRYKVLDFFQDVHVRFIDVDTLKRFDAQLLSFFNINTPDDYRLATEIAAKKPWKGE
jgi:molybdopterin-guanine dinucleotide biosynthesis protein A